MTTRTLSFRRTAGWLAIALAWLLVAPAGPAQASELDDAKRAGKVGEQIDGYLGAVDPSASGLVADINRKRRREYERIAAENDLSVDQVAALAGEKLVKRTPPGQMVRGPDGRWRKR